MLPENPTLEQLTLHKLESSPTRDVLLAFAKKLDSLKATPAPPPVEVKHKKHGEDK